MKKTLFLLLSLLSITSVACFAGCQKGDGDHETETNSRQIYTLTVDENEGEDENEGTCPDGNCKPNGMPKVHFEFKNGRPASRGDNDGGHERGEFEHGGRHHRKRPRPHSNPENPLPPAENGNNNQN